MILRASILPYFDTLQLSNVTSLAYYACQFTVIERNKSGNNYFHRHLIKAESECSYLGM